MSFLLILSSFFVVSLCSYYTTVHVLVEEDADPTSTLFYVSWPSVSRIRNGIWNEQGKHIARGLAVCDKDGEKELDSAASIKDANWIDILKTRNFEGTLKTNFITIRNMNDPQNQKFSYTACSESTLKQLLGRLKDDHQEYSESPIPFPLDQPIPKEYFGEKDKRKTIDLYPKNFIPLILKYLKYANEKDKKGEMKQIEVGIEKETQNVGKIRDTLEHLFPQESVEAIPVCLNDGKQAPPGGNIQTSRLVEENGKKMSSPHFVKVQCNDAEPRFITLCLKSTFEDLVRAVRIHCLFKEPTIFKSGKLLTEKECNFADCIKKTNEESSECILVAKDASAAATAEKKKSQPAKKEVVADVQETITKLMTKNHIFLAVSVSFFLVGLIAHLATRRTRYKKFRVEA